MNHTILVNVCILILRGITSDQADQISAFLLLVGDALHIIVVDLIIDQNILALIGELVGDRIDGLGALAAHADDEVGTLFDSSTHVAIESVGICTFDLHEFKAEFFSLLLHSITCLDQESHRTDLFRDESDLRLLFSVGVGAGCAVVFLAAASQYTKAHHSCKQKSHNFFHVQFLLL